MRSEVWPLVHAERAALAEDLALLDDAQWDEPSLCAGWTVRDVAAHLADSARATRPGFLIDMVRARFDFDRQNARGIERERGASPRETLARLRAAGPRTTAPPGPLGTRLVEEVVHGEDIRRPLGIEHAYDPAAVVGALRTHTGMSASMGGAKALVAGLSLRATDADLVIGEGPEVRGSALALLLATSGRRVALSELEGPGLEWLASG
ncbi:maleylpyruvate isomerase family mycothiol-dependent enzyme [Glycomyces endophyticus]|uniref:Maleylpyruvate isomerase family mycothiol-dependent enzyme n=1 Tax=Glycomyces endophyticus TaxID=480996 RepID=A0ABN2G824_9ACTN